MEKYKEYFCDDFKILYMLEKESGHSSTGWIL